jgi:hypothetical protein
MLILVLLIPHAQHATAARSDENQKQNHEDDPKDDVEDRGVVEGNSGVD